ncbi:hypothetical protein Tco_0460826, partial [Tanacetum coccineum]
MRGKQLQTKTCNEVRRSVGNVQPTNNNSWKSNVPRIRTPTQFSPLSKGNNNVELSETARITLTPRLRGRPRRNEISTRTPFQDVTPVGSLTFKSRILNGIDLDETVGDIATKGKSIRDK